MPAPNSAERLLRVSDLEVSIGGSLVGRLAQPSRRGPVLFEYDAAWIAHGYSISPFSLPLIPGVQAPPGNRPGSMHAVFEDSLPDDWGRLVVDRKLAAVGIDGPAVTPLARLALVGGNGMGTLEYSPAIALEASRREPSLDELFDQSLKLVRDEAADALDALYLRGSLSGGARPKVTAEIDGQPWLVKFPISRDDPDEGVEEFQFAQAAVECGIAMPEVRLLPSKACGGFFAVRRFDRVADVRGGFDKVHMASARALLEADPFDDTLDYRDLVKLCFALTSNMACVEQLYRIMCFNVFAGNCDDHVRNFSFLCDGCGEWVLSPAYDLTPNSGFFGEHSILVNGKGSGISDEDLLAVGQAGGLSASKGRSVIERIRATVAETLGRGSGARASSRWQ